jgi:hypothetical protein
MIEDKLEVLEKLTMYMVGYCLGYLVEVDFISQEKASCSWYTMCDLDKKLEDSGLLAGTSIDKNNRPFIAYRSKITPRELITAIPHESIHLAQICKGDHEPFSGYSIWKGQKYINLTYDDPNYFSAEHQPWEAEAKTLEEKVRQVLLEKIPKLKRL